MLRLLPILTLFLISISQLKAEAKYQVLITGEDAQEVQENAFKAHMEYPVSSLKCSQRCSQWWERQ